MRETLGQSGQRKLRQVLVSVFDQANRGKRNEDWTKTRDLISISFKATQPVE